MNNAKATLDVVNELYDALELGESLEHAQQGRCGLVCDRSQPPDQPRTECAFPSIIPYVL